jgi:hypothetical protein
MVLLVCTSANAQEIIRSYPDPFTEQGLGAFDVIGDIDGDDFPDLILGDPNLGNGSISMAGRVAVLSGRTGRVLYSYLGNAGLDRLGSAVAGIGDVNGDQVPDYLASRVTALTPSDHPVGHIWSGKDGKVLGPSDRFMLQKPWET